MIPERLHCLVRLLIAIANYGKPVRSVLMNIASVTGSVMKVTLGLVPDAKHGHVRSA